MTKWQLITNTGITLGFKESVTPARAVEKWREDKDQLDIYYDKYYQYTVEGNKINFN